MQPPSTPSRPVVDSHSHVIAGDTTRFPLAPMGGKQSDWSRERPVDDSEMLRAMADAGVARSALVQASTCYGLDNSYVAACVEADPRHFAGVFSTDLSSNDAIDRIQQWMGAGMSGARVFVAGHTAANHSVRLDDPRAGPAWEYLQRQRIPVAVQLRADKLDQLIAVLERHPDATVILDHCARPELDDGPPYRKAAPMFALARYPNLFIKYTTHNVRESRLGLATPVSFTEALVGCWGARRIAWGSNFPASPGTLKQQLAEALDATATLSAEDGGWIFGGTARALYPSLGAA